MATQMGFPEDTQIINDIAQALYSRHSEELKKGGMQNKIRPQNRDAKYCSMKAVMMELVDPQKIEGNHSENDKKLYEKIDTLTRASLDKAKKMEESGDCIGAIAYRDKMATRWEDILTTPEKVKNTTLEQIEK